MLYGSFVAISINTASLQRDKHLVMQHIVDRVVVICLEFRIFAEG